MTRPRPLSLGTVRRSALRLGGVAATTAAMCVASLAPAASSAASAATTSAHPTAQAAQATAHQVVPQRAVRCRLGLRWAWPHPIKGLAKATCGRQQPHFRLTVSIVRNGVRVAARTFTKSHTTFITGHVSKACAVGHYRVRAVVKITTPRGFSPHILTIRVRSREFTVTGC